MLKNQSITRRLFGKSKITQRNQLIDGKIRQACSRLFPKSVLDEEADRLNQASDSEDAELTIHLTETANIEEASGPELINRFFWMKEKQRWSRPVSLIRIGKYVGRWEFR